MHGRRPGRVDERGQASVEFVAVLPLLVLVGAALVQAALAGWVAWSAGGAARAAARAHAIGSPPLPAARSAVAVPLRGGVRVRVDGEEVRVRLRVPGLLAGLSPGSVGARARLTPQSGPAGS